MESITIGNKVRSIGSDAFKNCKNLTSIEIPESVTTIGSYPFNNCSKLTNVVFKDTTTWYVKSSLGTTSTKLDSKELANASTAAIYLKSKYENYTWTKK